MQLQQGGVAMPEKLSFLPAVTYLLAVSAIFAWLRYFLAPSSLIVILNGMFFGALAALVVELFPLVKAVAKQRVTHADVGWFTLGLMVFVFGVTVAVGTSLYIYTANLSSQSFTGTALSRYSVNVGLLTMVYSPDVGRGIFYGRDRKVAAISMVVGLAVAAATIYVQAYEVLA